MPRYTYNECCCCCEPVCCCEEEEEQNVRVNPTNRMLQYYSPPLLAPYSPPGLIDFSARDPFSPRTYLPENYFGPIIESDEENELNTSGFRTSDTAYTPTYTILSTIGRECIFSYGAITGGNHGPTNTRLNSPTWPTWNGTPINPCVSTPTQIRDFVWPSSNVFQMRGLKEVWDADVPFSDLNNPTVEEIEDWHVVVIGHYRDLIGSTVPISKSRSAYLRAQWSEETKQTRFWDAQWGSTCEGSSNVHCGASFLPNCPSQEPYLRQGEPCVAPGGSSAEGMFGGSLDMPWMVKLSHILRGIVGTEGITGHGGPFAGRPEVGMAYFCAGSSYALRVRWQGTAVNICA